MNEFEIEGLDELMKAFADLGEEATQKLREPAINAAEVVLAKAKGKIKNRSGALAKSLKISKPSKKNTTAVFASVRSNAKDEAGRPYSSRVELGHRLFYFGKKTNSDIDEKPFLRPAADESKDAVANIMVDAMNKILDEMGGLK